jgi:hypothetical protein
MLIAAWFDIRRWCIENGFPACFRPAGQLHSLVENEGNKNSSCLSTDHHTPVHEVISSHTLEGLQDRDSDN